MTGGQDYTAFEKLENICIGLGVPEEHIRVITPLSRLHDENVKIMKEEIGYKGISVIIPRRECIQTMTRRVRAQKSKK